MSAPVPLKAAQPSPTRKRRLPSNLDNFDRLLWAAIGQAGKAAKSERQIPLMAAEEIMRRYEIPDYFRDRAIKNELASMVQALLNPDEPEEPEEA